MQNFLGAIFDGMEDDFHKVFKKSEGKKILKEEEHNGKWLVEDLRTPRSQRLKENGEGNKEPRRSKILITESENGEVNVYAGDGTNIGNGNLREKFENVKEGNLREKSEKTEFEERVEKQALFSAMVKAFSTNSKRPSVRVRKFRRQKSSLKFNKNQRIQRRNRNLRTKQEINEEGQNIEDLNFPNKTVQINRSASRSSLNESGIALIEDIVQTPEAKNIPFRKFSPYKKSPFQKQSSIK
jgi:hypothetical protein